MSKPGSIPVTDYYFFAQRSLTAAFFRLDPSSQLQHHLAIVVAEDNLDRSKYNLTKRIKQGEDDEDDQVTPSVAFL